MGERAATEALLLARTLWDAGVALQPGMGLLCNNVLHDRSAFSDDPARPRLIYRARYYDRIQADIMLHAVPALHLTVHRPEVEPQIMRSNGALLMRQSIFGEDDFAPVSYATQSPSGLAEFAGVAPGHYSVMHGNPPQVTEIDTAGSQELDLSSGAPVTSVDMKVRMADGSSAPTPSS